MCPLTVWYHDTINRQEMRLGVPKDTIIRRISWGLRLPIFALQFNFHYDDVTMSLMASQITSLTIVYSAVYSGADQTKNQSSASLAFVRGIHRGPVNSPHKRPVTRKMFPFDDVIMYWHSHNSSHITCMFYDHIEGEFSIFHWRQRGNYSIWFIFTHMHITNAITPCSKKVLLWILRNLLTGKMHRSLNWVGEICHLVLGLFSNFTK